MTIVPMTSGDASRVSHIYAASWKAAYRGIVPQDYLDSLDPEYWTPFFSDPGRVGFLLRVDGRDAGAVAICPARDEAMPGWGELISIYLLPEYQGRGYGRRLFSHALGELGKLGFPNVYLWVLEENAPARRFYELCGFAPTGDRCCFTIGGRELAEVRYVGSTEGILSLGEKEVSR